MHGETEILVKGGLTLLALGAVAWRHLRPGRLPPERAGGLLWTIALVSVLAWTNFGQLHGRAAVHHWEQFHYFLGSKYFPELGYDGIYVASLAAERELAPGRRVQRSVRDLRTNEVVPTSVVAPHARQVRERFGDDRWSEFRADVGYFLERNRYEYLTRIRHDHGYNPTPTWTFVARLLSRWPAASDASLAALAWVDAILLGAMFVAVFRTFGSRVGCLSLIVFGLGYPWRFDWVGGAFLRHDWIAAVGLAVCAIRTGRDASAGGLLAYATMVRVFPGGFLVGPVVLAVRALRRREPLAWAGRLAAGFLVGIVLCLAAGALAGRGAASWSDFAANLSKHHGTWLTNNVGLRNVLLYDLDTMRRVDVDWSLSEPWLRWQAKMDRLARHRAPLLATASGLLLAVVGLAAWRQTRHQAAVLGIAVAFAAVVLTCYYWVMLLLLPTGRGRWVPTAGWLGINAGLFGLHLVTPSFEMIYGVMSWALAAFLLAWMGPDAWRTARELLRHDAT